MSIRFKRAASTKQAASAQVAPGIVPSKPTDSIGHRWLYLPRLLVILWQVARKDVLLQITLAVLAGLVPIVQLVCINLFVNRAFQAIATQQPVSFVLPFLVLLILSFLAGHLFRSLNTHMGRSIQDRLMTNVQELLIRKASSLSLSTFERSEAFDYLERARRGLDWQFKSGFELFNILSAGVAVIGALIYVAFSSLLFPLILLVGAFLGLPARMRAQKLRYQSNAERTYIERTLYHTDTMMMRPAPAAEVRLFDLPDHFLTRRAQTYAKLRKINLKLALTQMWATLASTSVQWITYSLVLISTVLMVSSGRLSLGEYAAYIIAVERFQTSLWMFFVALSAVDDDLRYIGDLFTYLDIRDEESDVPERRQIVELPHADQPTIVFEQVSFMYPGSNRPSITDLNLTIPPGQRITLVGENGAGKSTFAKLLLGLYAPTAGRITVNGVDIRQIDPSLWRRQCAAVFQDYVKYEATVYENIGFGLIDRYDDHQQIEAVARKSGAQAVIDRLPQGYNTLLGKLFDEGGQDLSEGQWQKLVIARAFFRDADVLVLDEPTAALDAKAEVELYRHFNTISQGKSAVFISHRLGTARLADRILVLQHGQVIEDGTHDDLIQSGGVYAEMLSLQAQWYK